MMSCRHSAAFLGTHILAVSYSIFIYYLGEGECRVLITAHGL